MPRGLRPVAQLFRDLRRSRKQRAAVDTVAIARARSGQRMQTSALPSGMVLFSMQP